MPILPLFIPKVITGVGSDHSPAHILRYLLIDLGETWSVYTANEPETPDALIVTTDSVSIKHGKCQVTGKVEEHFGVQILVRHARHISGWEKANSIARTLDENVLNNLVSIPADTNVPTATYSVIEVTRGPIFSLGRDRFSKRHYFTVNCRAAIRQIS